MEQVKKLYRSTYNRVIGGVAGGLAEYFAIDPLVVRLLFALLSLFGGGGVIIYIILWIFVPENILEVNSNDDSKKKNKTMKNEEMKSCDKKSGSLIAGVILITLGVLFLIDRYVPTINFGDLWPIILIAIGGYFIFKSTRKEDKSEEL